MKAGKYILYIVIFLIAGELLFRFDKATNFFDSALRVKQVIAQSTELTLLRNNQITIDSTALRIMVLGDSYIHGAGIESSKNFSNRLKQYFQNSDLYKNKNIYVLDVSRPSNNTLDNYNTYYAFYSKFKPQIIILGYNINDVDGDLDSKQQVDTGNHAINIPGKTKAKMNARVKLYKTLFSSLLLKKSLTGINGFLKSYGILVSGTEYDNMLKDYTLDKPQWRKSKDLLGEIITDVDQHNTQLIVLRMPEMNLIEYPRIFTTTDSVIQQFFSTGKNVHFINGQKIFEGKKSREFTLLKNDGHSNAKGQDLQARYTFDYIKSNVKINF